MNTITTMNITTITTTSISPNAPGCHRKDPPHTQGIIILLIIVIMAMIVINNYCYSTNI